MWRTTLGPSQQLSLARRLRLRIGARVSAVKFSSQDTKDGVAENAPSTTTTALTVTKPKEEDAEPKSSLEKMLKYAQDMIEESSGFLEIEKLKTSVQEASAKFDEATQRVSASRLQLAEAQKAHDQAHKKHVSLLMRREEWSAEDAASFVNITSVEVNARQALMEAQELLRRSEDQAIQCQHLYMDVMRQRYHEEQLHQDKWRLFGTYGTWSLIGINTLVFLVGQYRAERREIKRLNNMEELLIRSQGEVVSAITTAVASPPPTAEEHDKDAAARADADENTQKSGPGVPSESRIEPTTDKFEKPKKSPLLDADILGFAVHTPSVALGAAVTASCVVIAALLSGR